jgi:hypothetical protein
METPDTIEIACLPKNQSEEVRVSLEEYKGLSLVQMRVYVTKAGNGALRGPTRKGLSIRVAMLADLISALQAALRRARELGRVS